MIEVINSEGDNTQKSIEFVQSGLRGAPEIYKYGGHVLSKHSDRKYSLEYDNKRCVVDDKLINNLYDTKP